MSAPTARERRALNLVPSNPECPACKHTTHRVHRRLIDLLANLFVPILRFRCGAMDCDWEGNMRRSAIPHVANRKQAVPRK